MVWLSVFTREPVCCCRSMDAAGTPNGLKLKVGVIGGGAGGLVAARELKRSGFQVTVYERNHDVGGIWLYDPRIEEDDLLGSNPNRQIVSSSAYASLRANLPRDIMGFTDYPFIVKDGRDPRRFAGHQEMQLYLRDFATEFNLLELIKFSTEVVHVGMVPEHQGRVIGDDVSVGCSGADSEGPRHNVRWVVRSRQRGADEASEVEEVFDAVVVCSGHYTQPKIPQIPGMNMWAGKQMHSHNYRVPDPFCDKVVVIVGNSSSGLDISLELACVANEVHLSARSPYFSDMTNILSKYSKLWLHPMVESLEENGTVVFQDGSSVVANSIIYCTGYSYSFPFLDTKSKVTVDDNRVGPLYEHIFPPLLAPSLSFVGIPQMVVTFPLFEVQSKWIASILSGKAQLPSKADMLKSVNDLYNQLQIAGLPMHSTHFVDFFQHYDWLANQCGSAHLEDWRKEICLATINNIKSNIKTFRDLWDDQHLFEIVLLDKSINPIG